MGALHRQLGVLIVSGARCTFIKCHHDIGTYATLDVHHPLRGKQVARTVDMRLKGNPLFLHLSYTRQRKHLEATTVGQYGTIPTIELMEPTRRLKYFQTWTKIKVIGVSEDDLSLYLVAHITQMTGFHRAHRTNRHKNRSLYLAMICGEHSRTGLTFRVVADYFKTHYLNFVQKYNFFSTKSLPLRTKIIR